eukprot:13049-Heterococcus_DN1.PRE.1
MLTVLFTVLMSCLCAALTTGLDTTDVYYPAYFKGTWECKSITKEVEAPVGIDLFGGNRGCCDCIQQPYESGACIQPSMDCVAKRVLTQFFVVATYEKAVADIGTELNYKTRFRLVSAVVTVVLTESDTTCNTHQLVSAIAHCMSCAQLTTRAVFLPDITALKHAATRSAFFAAITITISRDIVVADRVFNIDSITTASMGQFAVLNTEQ